MVPRAGRVVDQNSSPAIGPFHGENLDVHGVVDRDVLLQRDVDLLVTLPGQDVGEGLIVFLLQFDAAVVSGAAGDPVPELHALVERAVLRDIELDVVVRDRGGCVLDPDLVRSEQPDGERGANPPAKRGVL